MFYKIVDFVNEICERITGKDKRVNEIDKMMDRIKEECGEECYSIATRWNRKDILVGVMQDGRFGAHIMILIPRAVGDALMYIDEEEVKVLPTDVKEVVELMKSKRKI